MLNIRWGRLLYTGILGAIALHNFGWVALVLVALASTDIKD